MRWLHRLFHYRHQLFAQRVQVHLLAQRGTEGGHYLGSVVLAAVEATINNPLKTIAQRLEEGRDGQSGDDDGHTAVLADDAPQQRLQANHQANIDYRQDDRERTIHQGAVDDDVDLPQPVAQQSNPDGEGDEDIQERCNQFDVLIQLR